MTTLAQRVVRRSLAGTATALLVVGLATAWLLDLRARNARDDELLAAAAAFAHAPDDPRDRWSSTLPGRAVVRHWRPEGSLIDPAIARSLIQNEESLWLDIGDERVLFHVTEPKDAHRAPNHPHDLVEVRGPQVRFSDAAGPFLTFYALVAATLATIVARFTAASITSAIQPMDDAVERLRALHTLGTGERLPEHGPAEVKSLLHAVNGMLDRLDEAFATQRQFTADAAHELRTPLAVLRGEIELALRRPRSVDDHVAVLRRLADAVTQLNDLVQGLMALARVDAGQVEQGRALDRISAVAWRAAQRECPSIAVEIRDDPEVRLHAPLCDIAIGNLIRNAVRHAPGGPDTLIIDADADVVRVEVLDRGPGVPEAAREACFERFARMDRRDVHGLGLGLPLARAVARRHGGDCGLAARDGGGSCAWFTVSRR